MSSSSVVFVTDRGDWGLFTGEQLAPAAPSPIGELPDNVRQSLKAVHVEGLAIAMQFSKVTLSPVSTGDTTHHVVASAFSPFPRAAIPDAAQRLRGVCSPATVSFVVENQVGWARATSADKASPQPIAAAVAHAMIVGGWDESDPIVVTVNGEAYQVSARSEASRWTLIVDRAW